MMQHIDFALGDIIQLKKDHACGGKEWEILRVGMDFRLKCLHCGHLVMLPRREVEKNFKKMVRQTAAEGKLE